jgi:deoxyribodipyrimidine photo-lyase
LLHFEAGIQWSQMQMQSGTTGINTVRIDCPIKQGRDHDPDGEFIRRWVPELAALPPAFLHASSPGTLEYAPPIVDAGTAMRAARQHLFAVRQAAQARAEADAVQARNGSRKAGLPATQGRRRAVPKGAAALQPDLFDAD